MFTYLYGCILCRYNNFQHDPLSACNCTPPFSGENAISARSDLNPASGVYPFSSLGHRRHGGVDNKVGKSPSGGRGSGIAVVFSSHHVACAFVLAVFSDILSGIITIYALLLRTIYKVAVMSMASRAWVVLPPHPCSLSSLSFPLLPSPSLCSSEPPLPFPLSSLLCFLSRSFSSLHTSSYALCNILPLSLPSSLSPLRSPALTSLLPSLVGPPVDPPTTSYLCLGGVPRGFPLSPLWDSLMPLTLTQCW